MAQATQNNLYSNDQHPQKNDGVEFEAIERNKLSTIPVVSQAFDNQWLPHDLLRKAIKAGRITTALARQLREIVRAEYIRSLVNGEQVIVNRAYLYNNENIYRDYLPPENSADRDEIRKAKENREAFKSLLQDKVLIPYLIYEKSPVEPPKFGTHAFQEWKRLCRDVHMQCLRLSWDDDQNKKDVQEFLYGRFGEFAVSLPMKNLDKLSKDLGLKPEDKDGLKKQLHRVARIALDLQDQKGEVTREDLYRTFIVTEGTEPVQRCYDVAKPFVGEIKELLDLAQVRNLPDALDGYLLTPINSLPRMALQDFQDVVRWSSNITAQDIMKVLKRAVFDLVQQGQYLQSMDLLSLPNVLEIRKTEEWYEYITNLKALIANPFSFAQGGAQAVHQSYAQLAARMTKLRTLNETMNMERLTSKTTFVVELAIEVGPATLSVIGMPHNDPIIQLATIGLSQLGKQAWPCLVRFVIKDIATRRANKGLSNSIEIMRGTMRDALKQWDELLRLLKESRAFQEGRISPDKAPNLTPPEPIV